MKFKEGKIIDRFYVSESLITIRFSRRSDAGGLMKYINSLVGEKARILLNRKQSLKEEKKWLADILEKSKKNKNVSLVAETNGNIIGCYQLKRNDGSKNHTATYAAGILKEYRKLGITKRVFKILERMADVKGIKLIQSSYFSDNKASTRLHKSLDFSVCGRIPKAAKFGNKYLDEVILYKVVRG